MSSLSMIPHILDIMDIEPPMYRQPSIIDEGFGWDIHPRDLNAIMIAPKQMRRQLSSISREKEMMIPTIGIDGFQANIDMAQFQPNEITVKIIDNIIIIEGIHEERRDIYGSISRQFIRKYALPKGFDPKTVISSISSDGILTIKAPTPQKDRNSNERIIQIQHTGPAISSIKQNPINETEMKIKK